MEMNCSDLIKKIERYVKKQKNWVRGGYFKRAIEYIDKVGGKYGSISVDKDITYLFQISDRHILRNMFLTKKTFCEAEISQFFSWSKEYYGIDFNLSDGYFLDIGANIGTTCIYVRKCNARIKCIAFEPDKDNFKVLKSNCIINECDDIVIENFGLSNIGQVGRMKVFTENRGRNYIQYQDSGDMDTGEFTEEVQLTTLDNYLRKCNINAGEISYIWIDTEGFEPFVINGAKKTLGGHKIPIWMEFSGEVIRPNDLEMLIQDLESIYNKILYNDYYGMKHEIEIGGLRDLAEKKLNLNIFLY